MGDDSFEKFEDVNKEREEKVIIMHGITKEELDILMKLIKENFNNYKDFIFATTTDNSLSWKLQDLIGELTKEHEYFKNKKK